MRGSHGSRDPDHLPLLQQKENTSSSPGRKPGTCALREIRKYQKSTDPILPKAPFSRVVREMMDKYANHATRVQSVALDAL